MGSARHNAEACPLPDELRWTMLRRAATRGERRPDFERAAHVAETAGRPCWTTRRASTAGDAPSRRPTPAFHIHSLQVGREGATGAGAVRTSVRVRARRVRRCAGLHCREPSVTTPRRPVDPPAPQAVRLIDAATPSETSVRAQGRCRSASRRGTAIRERGESGIRGTVVVTGGTPVLRVDAAARTPA